MLRLLLILLTATAALAQPVDRPELRLEPGEFDCTAWDSLLHRFVTFEGVDWTAWDGEGTGAIDGFLARAAEYDLRSVMGKEPKIAFLMNAYNAWAVKQVLDHYPVESLEEIDGFFTNPVTIAGEEHNLTTLAEAVAELAKPYPQCLAALATGARGYAPLSPRAYTAATLEAQASAAGRVLFSEQTEVDGQARTVTLPGIVETHREYFEANHKGLPGALHSMLSGSALVILTAPQEIQFRPIDLRLRERPSGNGES